MIIIDICVILLVIGLGLIGGPWVVRKLLRTDPKRKEIEAAHELDEMGETNTVRHNLAQLRNCALCRKPTDPRKDLRTMSTWMHADCYLQTVDLDKDKGKHNA